MTEGPISSCGVRSMKALESVVKSQMLPVDFQYCPGIKIPTDVCVLILSNSPSIIGDSVIKSFSPSSLFKAMDRVGSLDSRYRNMDGMAEAEFLTKSFDVSAVRHWWGLCRLSNASLDECMIPYVEEDFVNARQGRQPAIIASSPPYPVEATDFHNWLTLARLLAIADGSTKITASQWNRMRQLEADRYHNKSRYEAQISAVIQ